MLKPTHSVEELSEQSVTEQIWQKEQQEEATLHTTITLTAIPTHPLHAVTAVLQVAHHQVHQIILQAVPVNLVLLMIVAVHQVVVVVQNQVKEVVKSNSRY